MQEGLHWSVGQSLPLWLLGRRVQEVAATQGHCAKTCSPETRFGSEQPAQGRVTFHPNFGDGANEQPSVPGISTTVVYVLLVLHEGEEQLILSKLLVGARMWGLLFLRFWQRGHP